MIMIVEIAGMIFLIKRRTLTHILSDSDLRYINFAENGRQRRKVFDRTRNFQGRNDVMEIPSHDA